MSSVSLPFPPEGDCAGSPELWVTSTDPTLCDQCPVLEECKIWVSRVDEIMNAENGHEPGRDSFLSGVVAGEHHTPTDGRGVPINSQLALRDWLALDLPAVEWQGYENQYQPWLDERRV